MHRDAPTVCNGFIAARLLEPDAEADNMMLAGCIEGNKAKRIEAEQARPLAWVLCSWAQRVGT